MQNETQENGRASDKLDELVRCRCAACITIDDPEMVHYVPATQTTKQETPPPEGTLARTVWDARGGPAPRMMQRGFA